MGDHVRLLQHATRTFRDIARFFIESTKPTAVRARAQAAEHARRSGFAESFYASIWCRLQDLDDCLSSLGSTEHWDRPEEQRSIRTMLQTYEQCVPRSKSVSGHTQYPGLARLHVLHESGSSQIEEYRTCFAHLSASLREKLAGDIDECHKIFVHRLQSWSNLGHASVQSSEISDDLDRTREWTSPAELGNFAGILHARLLVKTLWRCRCSAASDGDVASTDVKIAFVIDRKAATSNLSCWVCLRHLDESWNIAHIHLSEDVEPVTTTTTVVTNQSKKQVHFDNTASVDKQYLPFPNFCEALRRRDQRLRVIRSRGQRLEVLTSRATTSETHPTQTRLVSMFESLPWASHPVPPKQRVILALRLVYYYLHLSGTDWWPTDCIKPIFWFTGESDQPDIRTPFFDFSLYEPARGNTTNSTSMPRFINGYRPSLPALGKLLLEIRVGHTLTWGDELFSTLSRCLNDQQDPGGENWASAVTACLDAAEMKASGSFENSKTIRKYFVDYVVKNIQWVAETAWKLREDMIFGATNELVASHHVKQAKHSFRRIRPRVRSEEALSEYCLYDDGMRSSVDEKQAEKARSFIENMHRFHRFSAATGGAPVPTKVAILDTGLCLGTNTRKLFSERLGEVRTWLNDKDEGVHVPDGADSNGHGTHCATAFWRCASDNCRLYVAQVFSSGGEKTIEKRPSNDDDCTRVARAINYAVKTWNVDVISMSFGYEHEHPAIEKELKHAEDRGVLLVAAASNVGGDITRAKRWPARRPNIISMSASQGKGHPYDDNPPSRPHANNFATLGVTVPVWSLPLQDNISIETYRTGTSIATPIAAAIIASVLEFMRSAEANLTPAEKTKTQTRIAEAKNALSTGHGMAKIFSKVAVEIHGYQFVQLSNFLKEGITSAKLFGKLVEKLAS